MNKKVVIGIILSVSSAVCAAIKLRADRQYKAEVCPELVAKEKCQDDILAYETAKKEIKLCKEVLAREKKELKSSFESWKKENQIDRRKGALYFAEDEAIKDFKSHLGYDDAISQLEQKKQESIDAFKSSIGFDEKISSLKEEISAAEKKWKDQESLFASADDNISEMASKLKHAAEDAKDAAVKKAKEQIAELEKSLKSEEDTWEKKIQQTRREYEEKINGERNRLKAKTRESLSDIDAETDRAYKDISRGIQQKRTDEEYNAVNFLDDNEKLIQTHDDIDRAKAMEFFYESTTTERLAWWFNAHKFPKWGVVVLGFTPVAAAEWFLACYAKFILGIVKAM